MVMTNRVSPKACSCGILAIPFLFLAAWISMPADLAACPPSKTDAVEPIKLTTLESGSGLVVSPEEAGEIAVVAESGRVLNVTPAFADDGNIELVVSDGIHQKASWHALLTDDDDPHHRHDAEERIARLERQMAQISEKLSILIDRQSGGQHAQAPRSGSRRVPILSDVPALGRSFAQAPATTGTAMATGIQIREYKLPENKLKALVKLMSRPDVPTRIRAVSGGIEVHGSQAEHAKFSAFVKMISGTGMKNSQSYRLSEGKLDDLTALMALDDVPVLIRHGDDNIRVEGGGLIQDTFREFVEMIEPHSRQMGDRASSSLAPRASIARGAYAAALKQEKDALAMARGLNRRNSQHSSSLHRRELRELEKHARALERAADELADEADRLREKAEDLEQQTDEMNSDQQIEEMRAAIELLMQRAALLDRESMAKQAQVEELERHADAVEARLDAVDERDE